MSDRLTLDEVADELRCSKRFVEDEIRRKRLRASKGSRWTVSRADLDVYIDAKANVTKVRGRSA